MKLIKHTVVVYSPADHANLSATELIHEACNGHAIQVQHETETTIRPWTDPLFPSNGIEFFNLVPEPCTAHHWVIGINDQEILPETHTDPTDLLDHCQHLASGRDDHYNAQNLWKITMEARDEDGNTLEVQTFWESKGN